ncbi:MAG: lysine exporter LysO family protein [Bacteroidales bacterium]|nr:lysine exporter LysO family protein [Bacteroidales bacterium]
MSNSLKILAFFAIGVLLGYMKYLPQWAIENDFSSYALYLLMFLVGIGIGADERAMKALKQFNLRLFMVPLTTITGTLIGVSLVYGFLGNISFPEVLAVGAGFGYYSLSSIIITDIKGAEPGVIALLSNVMREIITLLFAPIFVKVFGKLAPICSGGATSMDTTLPIISFASGKEYAIVSLFHGIVLTIIVPFLVTFILSF